jgi:pimeloyl-ACP methyl ester carboxylesterase
MPNAATRTPDDGPRFVRLPDGRRLAYAEYGAADGDPVLYFHGFPSSRREARLIHADALATGARIIAPDRPGYGDSDDAPGRTLADWAGDCAALVGQLGLARFAIIGVSGGGPYALACAQHLPARLPDRGASPGGQCSENRSAIWKASQNAKQPGDQGGAELTACTLVCPLGAIAHDELLRQMNPAARASLLPGRQPAWFANLVYGAPTTALLARWPDLVEKFRHIAAPPADRAVLREGDTAAILNRTIADAMRNGAPGARRDLTLYTHDWGLDLTAIRMPIRIWHGTADGTVPIGHARWLAEHLPNAHLTELPGEGHYSVPIRYAPQILTDLLQRHTTAETSAG